MRFEFLVLIIQIIIFLIMFLLEKKHFKEIFLSFSVTLYGPLYSLVNIPTSPKLTLNFIIAVLVILLTLNSYKINIKIFRFILFVLLLFILNIIFNLISLNSFFKFLQILTLIISSFSFGIYLAKTEFDKQLQIFRYISIFSALGGAVVIITRLIYGTTIRDAGYGLFHIFIFVFLLISYIRSKKKRFLFISFLSLFYILSIQTRSILILFFIFIALFYFTAYSWKKILYLISLLSLSIISFLILINIRASDSIDNSIQSPEFYTDPSIIMRLNALNIEWNAFTENILIGKGLLFNDELALYEINNVRDGAYVDGLDYSAYNHIGISSVLGQAGLFGFVLFIIYPFIFAMKIKNIFKNYDHIRGFSILLIIYFLSFCISGSPIRNDFQDMFWYYFALSFLLVTFNSKRSIQH